MGKRVFKRVDSNIKADLYYDNGIYEVTISNLSRNGMCIDTYIHTPCESNIEVVLLLADKVFKLRGKVKRVVHTNAFTNRIGVELFDSSKSYSSCVSNSMDYCYQTPF